MNPTNSALRIVTPEELENQTESKESERKLGIEILTDILTKTLPKEYTLSEYFESDGPRACFIYDWGTSKRTRFVKIDKPLEMITNPRARRHAQRGLATANDAEKLMKIPVHEAVRNGIAPLLAFYPAEYNGETFHISVEPYLSAHVRFKDFIEQKKADNQRLNVADFEKIFSRLTSSARYLINEQGIYHRDISYKNIMIDKNLETMLTDLSSAASIEENIAMDKDMLMTTGSKWFTDTRVFPDFNREPRVYDARSEIHSIGINMIYSILQKLPFDTDSEKGEVTFTFTGESLLDKDGKIDETKYSAAVRTIRNKLPRAYKKYADVIERAITRDRTKEFRSYDEFYDSFMSVIQKNEDRGKEWPLLYGAGAALIGLTLAAGMFVMKNIEKEKMELQIADVRKQIVTPIFDQDKLEIVNNFANIDMYLYESGKYNKIYPDSVSYLKVKPGAALTGHVIAKKGSMIPDTILSSSYLSGAYYFEGYEEIHYFHVNPIKSGEYYEHADPGSSIDIKIPENITNGLLNLAVEFWSPDSTNLPSSYNAYFKFPKSGTVIARKTAPIIIGDLVNPLSIFNAKINSGDYTDRLDFRNLENSMSNVDSQYSLIVGIPELATWEGYGPNTSRSSSYSIYLPMQRIENATDVILMSVAAFKNSQEVFYTALPIQSQPYFTNANYFVWRLAAPDSSFHTKLVESRRMVEQVKDTLSFKD